MHPVSYRASDGMLLHGYVLLPSGIAPDTAPLIACLHGGLIGDITNYVTGSRYRAGSRDQRGRAVLIGHF